MWTIYIDSRFAPAVHKVTEESATVTLRDILRSPTDREQRLACVALVARTGKDVRVMPDQHHRLSRGDQILLCGRDRDLHLIEATLHNEYTLKYLITGADEPRGYVMQWATRRLNGHQAPGT